MDALLSLLRRVDGLADAETRRALAALAPDLRIGGDGDALESEVASASLATPLAQSGFDVLSSVVDPRTGAALVTAVGRLVAAGWPAVFVYLFDEPWAIGEVVAARASALLGARYRVVEDVWAWQIAPGGRGWPPHRGIDAHLLSRDVPEWLNTWVALDDVEADRACMHFVPLDDDPAYPTALARLDVPTDAVRAAPLRAGDALAWNANVLHWGGPCATTARGPRVSCSFSLLRADAHEIPLDARLAEAATRDLDARLLAVARQIVLYGDGQPDVRAPVREWAHAAVDLAAAMRALLRKAE